VNIQLFYRKNLGPWNEAKSGLTGDVGKNVNVGNFKRITWDPIMEGKQLSGAGYEFKVVVDLTPLEILRQQRAEREREERKLQRVRNKPVHEPEYGADVAGSFFLFLVSGASLGITSWAALKAANAPLDSSSYNSNNANALSENPTEKSRIFKNYLMGSLFAGVTFACTLGGAIDLAVKASDATSIRRASIDFKDRKGKNLASAIFDPVIGPNFANNRCTYAMNISVKF